MSDALATRTLRALERLEADGDEELSWLTAQVRRLVAGTDRTLAGVPRAAWRAALYERRAAALRDAHAHCDGSLDDLCAAIELRDEDELDAGPLLDALDRAAAVGVGLPRRRSAIAEAVRSTTDRPDSRRAATG